MTGELNDEAIEAMLAQHYRGRFSEEDEGVDHAAFEALALRGTTTDPELALLAEKLREVDAQVHPRFAGLKTRWVALAIAASVAALALTQLARLAHDNPLTPKGESYDLGAVIARGEQRLRISPGDALQDGDRVALLYSAPQSGFLAVLHRDANGVITPLYPAGRSESAAIARGSEVLLPDGAIAESGTGCEWFVAVFSDAPLLTADLQRAIAQGRAEPGSCKLDVPLEIARTVRVLSVRRSVEPR